MLDAHEIKTNNSLWPVVFLAFVEVRRLYIAIGVRLRNLETRKILVVFLSLSSCIGGAHGPHYLKKMGPI